MPLDMEVGLGPGDFVFDGGPAPPRKEGMVFHPIFGPCLCQTAGWTMMPLGTEVNLGPGDVLLDGIAALPLKGTQPPVLAHVYCGQTTGCTKTPFCTEVDLGPGHIVLDGDPASLTRNGHSSSPLFGPCLLWPRSPISASAELLY